MAMRRGAVAPPPFAGGHSGAAFCCFGAGVTCAPAACPENASGDPECACDTGYEGTLSWADDTDTWDGSCTNIDECETGADDCSEWATCTDNDGGWDCACNSGYAGDGIQCDLSGIPGI